MLYASQPIVNSITCAGSYLEGLFLPSRLIKLNKELEIEAVRLRTQLVEKDRLLEQKLDMLSVSEKNSRSLNTKNAEIGQVISYSPLEGIVTIDKGKTSNISPLCPVINGDGLVGVVRSVENNYSEVLLVTSPEYKMGAMVESDVPVVGLVTGDTYNSLNFEFQNEHALIQINDYLVTSGYSLHTPKGIPIGKIYEIDMRPDYGIRRARIYPCLKIGKFQYVSVLKNASK